MTQPPTRRDLLKAIGIGAAGLALPACAAASGKSPAPDSKPNILMILVDDLGYGDLSCCGAADMQTPNIDKLFASGIRLDNFYASCPVCSPTRAALLTGRYPDLVGVPGVIRTHIANNWGYLDPRAVMLPRLLKKTGYHTAIVGKWHLGLASPNTPNERGFDHFAGCLGDMMDDYYTHRRHAINYMRLEEKEIDPEGHATDLFTQWSIDYITARAQSKKPFFLYLAYNAPHTPIQPPEDWLAKVEKRQPGITEKRAKLVALIEHLDDGIGKVLAALRQTAQGDNTLVIFTSDNGGQLGVGANNGPLRGGKQDMYEGGLRVPACAAWPGKIRPGSKSDRLALTMDLFPTICDAANAKIEHKIEGRTILPTLLGMNQPAEDRFLFWVRREAGPYAGRAYYAARLGDFKLLQNSPFEPLELYDLKEDPKEQNPLGKKHPMYNKLLAALRNHIIEAGAVPWQKYPVNLKDPLTP
ncbi:MAG: sulfatase-like hydrolase/transferase [Sedimentisphaerales bacterium]|nr:sulfatase-like hydrolase/transferase [Sedimentisphaerales bacterium]